MYVHVTYLYFSFLFFYIQITNHKVFAVLVPRHLKWGVAVRLVAAASAVTPEVLHGAAAAAAAVAEAGHPREHLVEASGTQNLAEGTSPVLHTPSHRQH